MNSGLISGPVQAAKNGRWRKWELTNGVMAKDLVNLTTSTAETISRIVPIPSYVTVVRVSATAPGWYANAAVANSGAACKNVLVPIIGGRRFVVAMDNAGIWFGVLRHASEVSSLSGIDQSTMDLAVRLANLAGGNTNFQLFKRGVSFSSVTTTGQPATRPLLGGTFVTGFTPNTTTNTPNPLDPQVRSLSGGNQPSMLFGGPLPSTLGSVPTGMPGAAYDNFDPSTNQCSPAYICVEWME